MMESDEPVSLIVRSTRAPFLSSPDDPAIPNSGYEPVSLVRDPACDMARLAKRGSQIVHDKRNERERQRATASAIEVNQSNNSSSNISSIGNSTDNDTAAALTTLGDYVEEKTQSAADILKQRQSLPAYASKNELLRSIRDNQVVIIVGETGSGKTTQLTQYLYSDGFTSNGGMIACTQPRRVAAVSVAERVSIEMDSGSVGGLVGYSIRFEDLTSPKTKIKYMTDGILVREALADPYLDRYSVIIIDEAHERALSTDILLGLLKRATSARSDLRLVVTSATLDAQRFASFFGNAPIIHISGRTFPVDINYSLAPADDYVASSVQQALAIHASQPPGDILIFLPGREEVEVACSVMAERLAKLDRAKPLLILPAYSMLRSDLQQRIFAPAPQGSRKCVIATNIAETSLTIDGIRYVVDPGYAKIKAFNPRIGIDSLQVAPISQASANQRAGRAGRTAAGVCFRLYSEDAFMRDLLPATVPEIQRTSLASSVLLLLALGVSDITSFPLIDPPPKAAFHDALQRLWILGAVDATGSLTDVGREMAALPLDPVLARMLVDAIHHNCTAEVLTIVSMLSVPQVFARPRAQLEQADAARERFCVPESDHLSLLNVFKQWTTNSRSTVWCNKNFISSRSMYQAEDVCKQLADIISRKYGDEAVLQTCGRDWDVVRRVVCRSLFHQAAKMTRIGEYADMRTGLPCYLHPTSSLFGMGLAAPYVVYSELIFTQKEYMQCVTAVEPRWLAEAGPMFYTIE
ncbi:P-loop containing nucleoside triphosphate hydrolase protein, partial [Ramicandelaber brevisporus]